MGRFFILFCLFIRFSAIGSISGRELAFGSSFGFWVEFLLFGRFLVGFGFWVVFWLFGRSLVGFWLLVGFLAFGSIFGTILALGSSFHRVLAFYSIFGYWVDFL